jgi:D-sedoheptulose 7-phosphate isomerase
MSNNTFLRKLIERYPQLIQAEKEIMNAAECLSGCSRNGGKVLLCGNGGSSADSDHIAGELMKGFEKGRPMGKEFKERLVSISPDRGKLLAEKLQRGVPAISLSAQTSIITAVANDIDPDLIFAQQVAGYGNAGDVLVAISTSGNSRNVIDAAITAKAKGMTVIGLTGETGGKLAPLCDILINVPGKRTSDIQELHLPVYHTICRMVEDTIFGNEKQKLIE